jgi:hypothetical protein
MKAFMPIVFLSASSLLLGGCGVVAETVYVPTYSTDYVYSVGYFGSRPFANYGNPYPLQPQWRNGYYWNDFYGW